MCSESAVGSIPKYAGGTINVAVATMAIFFAVGFVFLRLADRYDAPRHENN